MSERTHVSDTGPTCTFDPEEYATRWDEDDVEHETGGTGCRERSETMGDRLRPYALVVLDECDEYDGERGWCMAEYDSEDELGRWMSIVGRCGYRMAHKTWARDRDGRPTGATVVMVREGKR